MSLDSLRDTFFTECEDLLDATATGLAAMSDGSGGPDTVNAVFRAVHSIKGAAGAFHLAALVGFAHRFETVLDAVRAGQLSPDPPVMRVLSRAGDVLADLVEAARAGYEPDPVEPTLAALDGLIGAPAAVLTEPEWEFTPVQIVPVDPDSRPPAWEIGFRPTLAFLENGHDPATFLLALGELGETAISCDLTGLPPLESYDPEASYLAWRVLLHADAPRERVEDVFAFADGLCDLAIAPHPEGALPAAVVRSSPAQAQSAEQPPKPLRSRSAEPAAGRPTLRVDLERVDKLVNTVGELIINQATISERLTDLGAPLPADLVSDLDAYKLLAREIQEAVMAIRAQPVRPLFQRMARIVREVSAATGKQVQLVTEGEGTEVDRTVVEQLSDPLTHMVRNAIDHGIELLDERRKAGKADHGTIHLSAEHQSGCVVIRIRDDGAGLKRDRIREIAVRKGLVPPEAELSNAEIDNLLFAPGFSTAPAVTDLSGRGVGLDVVKTAITALGGRVGIDSDPGRGSTFSIVLPLTLAVMDGMLVTVAGQTMVLPISSIVETIRPQERQLRPLGRGGHLVSIRGAQIPVVDLAERLGQRHGPFEPARHILILVRTPAGAVVALAVERISDHRQVVIKSLQDNYGRIPGISAATVLGDGTIALIVDPDSVIAAAEPAKETAILG